MESWDLLKWLDLRDAEAATGVTPREPSPSVSVMEGAWQSRRDGSLGHGETAWSGRLGLGS